MKKALFLLLLSVLGWGVQSCEKDVATDYDHVLLRVENKTSMDFRNVFASDTTFDDIPSNSISIYKHLDKIDETPTAFLEIGDETIVCGLLHLDYRGFIESGKYTLQIFENTSTVSGYDCRYIKE